MNVPPVAGGAPERSSGRARVTVGPRSALEVPGRGALFPSCGGDIDGGGGLDAARVCLPTPMANQVGRRYPPQLCVDMNADRRGPGRLEAARCWPASRA